MLAWLLVWGYSLFCLIYFPIQMCQARTRFAKLKLVAVIQSGFGWTETPCLWIWFVEVVHPVVIAWTSLSLSQVPTKCGVWGGLQTQTLYLARWSCRFGLTGIKPPVILAQDQSIGAASVAHKTAEYHKESVRILVVQIFKMEKAGGLAFKEEYYI